MVELVNFNLAKLLKEKGFDEPTLLCYDRCDMLASYAETVFKPKNYNTSGYVKSAPIIAEVVMWLYKKYGIWVSVHSTRGYFVGNWMIHNTPRGGDTDVFDSPTEAYETAVEYVLNNLI